MKINEIAGIARVTPRAIRHYHLVGALPEPERRPNGYRDYSVIDLTRLLRLRRLLALGFPLSRIGPMLDEASTTDIEEELNEIEHDLLRQIHDLRRQLAAVAAARTSPLHGAALIYDAEHAAVRDLLAAPDVRRMEQDIGTLLEASGDPAFLAQLRTELADSGRLEQLARLSKRLRDLTESSPRPEHDEVAADLTALLSGWVTLTVNPAVSELIDDYMGRTANPAQTAVLARVSQELERQHKAT